MDHLDELASVFLERERRTPEQAVIDDLRAEASNRLSKDADASESWNSDIEAKRREALIGLLWTDPQFAAELARKLEFVPRFVRNVAEGLERESRRPRSLWDELKALGCPAPADEESTDGYVHRVGPNLLREPVLLARAAAMLGSAVPFSSVLTRELNEITAARLSRDPDSAVVIVPPADPSRRADEMKLVGLAFSGGGIRSATFNLGVIQALAGLGLLRRFDLLSTVSGGGYIGGWLAACIKRHPAGVQAVEGDLGGRETWPVTFLRQYSNYLTPQLGFFSADTWTLVTTWVRNTLLNQSVLVLFLATALLIPHVVLGFQVWGQGRWNPFVWLVLAADALLVVSVLTGEQLRDFERQPLETGPRWSSQTRVQFWIIIPALLAGIFAAGFLASWLQAPRGDRVDVEIFLIFFAMFAAGLGLTQWIGGFGRCFPAESKVGNVGIVLLLALVVLVCAVLGAAVLMLGMRPFAHDWFRQEFKPWGILIFGPPLLMQSYALAVTLQQGLLGRQFPDERREWWSRAGAWVLIYSTGWGLLSIVVILVPYGLLYGVPQHPLSWDLGKKAVLGLWGLITASGVLAAQSDTTGSGDASAKPRSRWLRWLAIAAPYVFIAGLVILLSTGVFLLLTRLLYPGVFSGGVPLRDAVSVQYWCLLTGQEQCGSFFRSDPDLPHSLVALSGWGVALLLGVAGGALALILAWRVDVNEFSMHHFYKNRLVRCYLGGARARNSRAPNPFTGFDPDDDIPLARMHLETRTPMEPVAEEAYDGPYQIINTALNLVTGENLAWQERRAASFAFTPHYSGFEVEREPGVASVGDEVEADGFRPTATYGYPPAEHPGFATVGGIHLGTALAISGAAANPNMGYHSSSAAAFLMTVFNVRLGWWMGNPRHRKTHMDSSPRILGLAYLLNELTGNSDDRSRYVNLSDGGHFDNLGIYELVRRRCRFILACDAEQDGALAFGGLGNAIRKCRADFGVDIKVRPVGIRPLDGDGGRTVHCAVGTIEYDRGASGILVYLKSSLTGDEPTDVLEYRSRQPLFPHQSTGDQWFDESQFESYRALGYHIAMRVLGKKQKSLWDAEAFFQDLESRWHPPSATVERHFTRHVEAYDTLMERMRKSTVPASLDAALYPALGANPPPFPNLAALLGASTIPSAGEERTAFYLCNSLILLMERVFLDLDLESEDDHPHNQGWITIFREWVKHPQFKAAWSATARGYGERFQRFVSELSK